MNQHDEIADKYATVRRINRKTARLSYFALVVSALAILSALGHLFVSKKRATKERELSRKWESESIQWQSNYVSMKAAFDTLEAHCLICQTNFQALVDALAGQKAVRAK